CCTAQQFRFLEVAARFGLRLVYDLDDNVWDLPEYNPARPILSQYREGFYHCMSMVDVISVSTPTLARIIQRQIKNLVNRRTGRAIPVIVAENRIQEKMFAPPVKPAEDKIVIGWAGSSSHIGDLPLIQGALEEYMGRPDVELELRGVDLPVDNPLRGAPNYRFKHWTPVSEYPARMPVWGWHIALAPLTDHEFNQSKSSIKMIEAGYCGIPCLVSWSRPYESFCRHHPDLKWLLCSGPSAWKSKLRDLVHDKARREYLGQLMRKTVEDHYTFRKVHTGWEEVLLAAREHNSARAVVTHDVAQNRFLDVIAHQPNPPKLDS